MRLLGKEHVEVFKNKHPTTRRALDRWVSLVEGASFGKPHDIKLLFGLNVDFVGLQTVFDVGGNKIRTIVKIEYGTKIVLITHVLTHIEYDKGKWRDKK